MVPEGRRAADPSAPPPIAWPYERLGPVVIADNPCLAASSSFADPDFGNKAFTGREWDSETNLYYYRARYYDPKMGRFTAEDPIHFGGGNNFYAYVLNNPVNHVDPLGLAADDWLPCVVKMNREVLAGHCGNGMNANDDPSCREAHCIGNCRITRECFGGSFTAAGMSYLKESSDWVKKKTWDPNSEGYSQGDQNANKKGRVCGSSPHTQP